MSIAPLPPPTPATVPTGATGATTAGHDGGFAALVAALLGAPQPATAQPPAAAPSAPTAPTAPTAEEPESSTDVPDAEGDGEDTSGTSVDAVSLPVLGVPAGAPDPSPRTGGPRIVTAQDAAPPTGAAPVLDAAPATSSPAPSSPAPSAPEATPVTATATPPVAPAVPLGRTPLPSTPETRPAPVVAQLSPEVTRLVSRGDGVHRITMRLQPEALGEVRVTLTVRAGEVHVRLAAGDRAQQALVEGAPELRRVLELTGATDTRVVVRDLAGGLAPGSPNASPTPAPGGGGGGGDNPAPGQGHAGTPDQHARTRGGSTAKDGLTDGTTASRPEPARRSPRGVDLTM